MTNNTNITAANLEHMDRILDPEGNEHTINNIRMIDHERVRITTLEGKVRVAHNDDIFELLS